jgi:hypothetical protein
MIGNRVVRAILTSPVHGLLSRSTDLVRYTAPRTGREIVTPTQYARHGEDFVILVARPETKTWWRNFRTERNLDLLVRRRWRPMVARAVRGADEPGVVAALLDAYLARFPRAARALEGSTFDEVVRSAVVVWCRPR